MYGDMAGSGSRVMTTGGLGLFFEPGGLPLGRRGTSMVPPSSEAAVVLGFLEEGEVGVAVVVSSESLAAKGKE